MGMKCNATGKVIFLTKEEAKNRMLLLKIRFHYLKHKVHIKHRLGNPHQKRVYYCPHCLGFHLTSWTFNYLKFSRQKNKTFIQVGALRANPLTINHVYIPILD